MYHLIYGLENSIQNISNRKSKREATKILESYKVDNRESILDELAIYATESKSLAIVLESYKAEKKLVDMGIIKDINNLKRNPVFENSEDFQAKMDGLKEYINKENIPDYQMAEAYVGVLKDFSWNTRVKSSIDRYKTEVERDLPKIMIKNFLDILYKEIGQEINKEVYKNIVTRLEFAIGLPSNQIPSYIKSSVSDYYYILPELKNLVDELLKTDFHKNSSTNSVLSYFGDTKISKDKKTVVESKKDGSKIVLLNNTLYKVTESSVQLLSEESEVSESTIRLCESFCKLNHIDRNKFSYKNSKDDSIIFNFDGKKPVVNIGESEVDSNDANMADTLYTTGFEPSEISDVVDIASGSKKISEFEAIYVESPSVSYTIIKKDGKAFVIVDNEAQLKDAIEYEIPSIIEEISNVLGVDISSYFGEEIENNEQETSELEFEKTEYENALTDINDAIEKIEASDDIDSEDKKELLTEAKKLKDETVSYINLIKEKLETCQKSTI